MQVNRPHQPHNTLFPPAGGQPDAAQAGQAALPVALGRAAVTASPDAQSNTPPAEGVVLKLSTKTDESPEQTIYSRGKALGGQKIDLNNMTLENQLALGRNQGVFTKITLSKDGVLLAQPDPARKAQAPEFVSSAVTAMRDFQEGIAALSEQAPESSKTGGFFSDGLRSLQQAAAKLNVFA